MSDTTSRAIPEPAPRPGAEATRAPSLGETPFTATLIVLCALVFGVEILLSLLGGASAGTMVWSIPSGSLLATGANYWAATLREGRFETLLASTFVHGGVLHIAFNMMALRAIGPFVEKTVGAARMLPLYLLSGFVASFVSTFFNVAVRGADGVGVGASGAICGLIGAALVIGWRVEGRSSPLMWTMIRWLGMTLFVGFVFKNVDNAAHVGGAMAGAVIALLWRRGLIYSSARRAVVLGACGLVLLLTFARVVERDVQSPLALLTTEDRLEAARALARRGDCAGAARMASAAQRLTPHDEKTLAEVRAIDEACAP